jgi:hypothetical protein
MQRAGRIIYNGAMVVSLLLCLGCAGVWVRSGWVNDCLAWCDYRAGGAHQHINLVSISKGGVQAISWYCTGGPAFVNTRSGFHYTCRPASEYPLYETSLDQVLRVPASHLAAIGFEVVPEARGPARWDRRVSITLKSLTLPLYFPTLLFALLPAHYFLRVRRRRRIAKRLARGCCPACGYDLRASAGRCPECGFCGAGVPPASSAAGTAAPQQQP